MQKFVRHISIGYLALLMLIKMLGMPLICIQFVLNKEYIAANLCENKDKPAMHCSGKCHLKKQLNKANETGNTQNQKGNSYIISIDCLEDIHTHSFFYLENFVSTFSTCEDTSLPIVYPGNIFRPPFRLLNDTHPYFTPVSR